MFAGVAAGLSAAMSVYISTYFWGFLPQQIGILVLGIFISAVIGPMLAPMVTRLMGKKRGAMVIGLVAFLGSPLPIALKLFGLLPDDPAFIFNFVFIAAVIDVALIICFQVLFTSMIADLVEQAELKTGRRNEGVFFAVVTFVRKSVQGFGVLAASLVLALADFPKGAAPADVPADAVWRLGAWYAPTILAFWLAMLAVMSLYKLDRAGHEENLRKLSARVKS
jgi:glycoside/pentoside/hexuronide:cation symporter, GPH family